MVEAVQAPAPLQSAAVVAVLPVHDAAAPHDVVVPGNTQLMRLVPSQWPAQVPVPAQGVFGVVVATHVPRLLVVTHDSHCPLQAVLQHTPSEPQTVLAHSLPALHELPFVFRVGGAPPAPADPAAPPDPRPPVPDPPEPGTPPVLVPPVPAALPPAAPPASPAPAPPLLVSRPPEPPPVPETVVPPVPSGPVPPLPVDIGAPPLPEARAPPLPDPLVPPWPPPVPDDG